MNNSYNLLDLFQKINNTNYNTLLDIAMILNNYKGSDWKEYITKSSNYYKKLIYSNTQIEIFVITWMPGASTRIHDHPTKGCLVKILEGELIEDEFNNDNIVIFKNRNILKKDDIGFKINDNILHKINNFTDKLTVSLHIYSMPNFKITYY